MHATEAQKRVELSQLIVAPELFERVSCFVDSAYARNHLLAICFLCLIGMIVVHHGRERKT